MGVRVAMGRPPATGVPLSEPPRPEGLRPSRTLALSHFLHAWRKSAVPARRVLGGRSRARLAPRGQRRCPSPEPSAAPWFPTLLTLGLGAARPAGASVVERVVAVVGDRPILLSEFLATWTRKGRARAQKVSPGLRAERSRSRCSGQVEVPVALRRGQPPREEQTQVRGVAQRRPEDRPRLEHQTSKKRAYGFRNKEHFRTAIYFQCGGLELYPAM
jgi:hypothetical protein